MLTQPDNKVTIMKKNGLLDYKTTSVCHHGFAVLLIYLALQAPTVNACSALVTAASRHYSGGQPVHAEMPSLPYAATPLGNSTSIFCPE
jgi:hypothetical protein